MGTVRGDLHDIGKNLVGMMAEGAGFEVHDIGVDQSVEKFMAAAEKCKPNIIGMSALLTTTMMYMKTVIEGFHAAGLTRNQDGGRRRSHQPDVCRRDWRRRIRSQRLRRGGFVPAARRTGVTKMATYKILYWQEIPTQIKADDGIDDVTVHAGREIHGADRSPRRHARTAGCRRLPGAMEVERRTGARGLRAAKWRRR